MQGRFLLA